MEIINNKQKIKSFVDLVAWQEAHRLVILVYKITKDFPKEEIFILVNQMRRAAISVTSNIVEGCARESQLEYHRFLEMAFGSLRELSYQFGLAIRLGFITEQENSVNNFKSKSEEAQKVLGSLIRSMR